MSLYRSEDHECLECPCKYPPTMDGILSGRFACGVREVPTEGINPDCPLSVVPSQECRLAAPWVSVEERLPEEQHGWSTDVIVCVGPPDNMPDVKPFTRQDRRHDGEWETYAGCNVTHWMPLPAPPFDKKGGE
jgi:hypothetical protein